MRNLGVTGRWVVAVALVVGLVGCAGEPAAPEAEPSAAAAFPHRTFDAAMLFPADGSLMRAEDGVALPDGRLIVADQAAGLRLVRPDGSSEPFGDLPGAGYRHDPPDHAGGANGVALEPDGGHVLVADIHHGGIYRVDVATGETERVHRHTYGVNTAVRDARGTIWFTQSAHNTPEEGEARMWAAVDTAAAEGALYRLPANPDGRLAAEAELVLDGLQYANGVAIDEASGHLYVAETMGGRVLRYRVDLATGTLDDRTVVVDGILPDNLELDATGRLWVAAPIRNAVIVLDPATGEHRTVFEVQTPAQREVVAEILRRVEAHEPCLELLTPEVWAPLPGLITGVILGPGSLGSAESPAGATVYLSNLGDALVRLPPPADAAAAARLLDFATRYAAAWSGGDPDALAAFYADDGTLTVNDGEPAVGRAAIAARAGGFMEAFPDMVVTMDSVDRDGDRATFHWIWTGTNTGPGGTGRSVHLRGYEAWTLTDDGRIRASDGHYDEAEYDRQVNAGEGEEAAD